MNFRKIVMHKVTFAKFLSQKKVVPCNHSFLKYTLEGSNFTIFLKHRLMYFLCKNRYNFAYNCLCFVFFEYITVVVEIRKSPKNGAWYRYLLFQMLYMSQNHALMKIKSPNQVPKIFQIFKQYSILTVKIIKKCGNTMSQSELNSW